MANFKEQFSVSRLGTFHNNVSFYHPTFKVWTDKQLSMFSTSFLEFTTKLYTTYR